MDSDSFNKPSPSTDGNGRKVRPVILCVDDEPNILYVRNKVLDSAGYAVLSATYGAAALARFIHDPVDLVLLDFYLQAPTAA